MISWDIVGTSGVGLAMGLIMTWIMDFFERRQLFRKARLEGDNLLHKAEEEKEQLLEQTLKRLKDHEQILREKFDIKIRETSKKLSELRSKADKKAYELNLKKKESRNILNKIQIESGKLQNQNQILENSIHQITDKLKETHQKFLKTAQKYFPFDLAEIKHSMEVKMLEEFEDQTIWKIEKWEKEQEQNLEKNALFYLHCSLNRFFAPYCSEKGIETVSFLSKRQMREIIGPDKAHLNKLEAECGVDIVIHEEELYGSILGIDPVRRELGRMTLRKLLKVRHVNGRVITSLVKKSKRELFERIKKDGKDLCQRLGLKNTAKEVENMMGSLRYRYSFAQNQYFHCEEVGWLCGLLSSEIDLSMEKGRKAGLFHDIGKAMDHSIEGNHAVIGANFIEEHGEPRDIVHAVKAHHHDVSPSTPLAFLVIVSDAISGSRPGARRFTEDSYAKKLAQLEEIADSFENIKDAYIMNAGREMRIIVEDENIDDREALELSKKVARKIERECAYPGLIKVTVVRHSEVATAIH